MYVIFHLYKNPFDLTYKFTCGVSHYQETTVSSRWITDDIMQHFDDNSLLKLISEELVKECLVDLNIESNTAAYTEGLAKASKAFEKSIIAFENTTQQMSSFLWSIKSLGSFDQEGNINGVGVSKIANQMPGYNIQIACPGNGCLINSNLGYIIIHLNDNHKWTREHIADWLDEQHDAGNINIEFGSDPIDTRNIEAPKASSNWSELGYTKLNEEEFSLGPFNTGDK